MFKESDVKGDDIANGYIVDFYLAYDEELQRKCAKGIRVIDSSVGIYSENKASKKKQNNLFCFIIFNYKSSMEMCSSFFT